MSLKEKSIFAFAIVLMGLTLWLPIWQIDIWAPQYPEGLLMRIGASSISGDVDQINLLNHYIGMQKIIPSQIPELTYIPWIIASILVLGALVIVSNKKVWGGIWLGLIGLLSIIGMIDFYNWGFNYGHNLNPDAPIKMAGLSYQPPLFGFKKILNIEAYSLPDLGTYAFAIGFALAFCVVFWDVFFRPIDKNDRKKTYPLLRSLFLLFSFTSCTSTPEPLKANVDQCHHCHMQIADTRFGGEIITKKGRIYKFDSIQCLHDYLEKNTDPIESILVADYFSPESLVKVDAAHFLSSSKLAAPMGAGIVASKDVNAIEKLKAQVLGKVTDWKGLPFSSF